MRELHADTGAPADLQILFDRIEKMGRFVADVARIQAALIAHDIAERGELVRRSEGARRVDEARREPDRAFVHRLRQKGAHPRQLVLCRCSVVRTHHARPQRAVAYERAHIDGGFDPVDCVRVLAEGRPGPLHVQARELPVELGLGEAAHRRRRATAVPADDQGHPHVQRALERVVHEHRLVGVRMDVDEPGRDDAILRLNGPRPVLCEVGVDRRDASAAYGDVRAPSGGPGPVDHRSAADEKVGHECRRSSLCPRSFRFATTRSLRDRASAGFPS